jgi:hypothetical protein
LKRAVKSFQRWSFFIPRQAKHAREISGLEMVTTIDITRAALHGETAGCLVPGLQMARAMASVKELLFTVEVIQGLAAKEFSFRRTNQPLVAIRIVTGFADWIIRDHVKNKVLGSVVD